MREEGDERGSALAEVVVVAEGRVQRIGPGVERLHREVAVLEDAVNGEVLPRIGAGVLAEVFLALVGEAGVDVVDDVDDAADLALRLLGDGGVVIEKGGEVGVESGVILGVEAQERVEMPLDERLPETGPLELGERRLEGANGLRVEFWIDAGEESGGFKVLVGGPVVVEALARSVVARSSARGALSRFAWSRSCEETREINYLSRMQSYGMGMRIK